MNCRIVGKGSEGSSTPTFKNPSSWPGSLCLKTTNEGESVIPQLEAHQSSGQCSPRKFHNLVTPLQFSPLAAYSEGPLDFIPGQGYRSAVLVVTFQFLLDSNQLHTPQGLISYVPPQSLRSLDGALLMVPRIPEVLWAVTRDQAFNVAGCAP